MADRRGGAVTIKLPAPVVGPVDRSVEQSDDAGAQLTELLDRDLLEGQAGRTEHVVRDVRGP